ncbi:MAG: PilN domain-containing protein [Gloeocapsa sp. UFS-A4-WI-NPMV-4B04]|jgi:type IV pilus assembly protein PilN|nr:PilN domain-containing protein [Gloeocapsa sp. UFS-A4-WI-NPMV-4B04]
MYSLDVNFIKDRPDYNLKANTRTSKFRVPVGNFSPLYLGLATGLLLPALVGIGWLFLQSQNSQLEQQIAELDIQLNRLGIQEQEIKTVQAETNQIKAENQALATVFNQIKPWSAMLQDIRDRIPATVQIDSIKQVAAAAPATPQPAASPSPSPSPQASPPGTTAQGQAPAPIATPVGGIEITGIARSFNDVNDFLLTLQQSAFLQPTDTRIVTAELVDSTAIAGSASPSGNTVVVRGPQFVRYTIQSSLSDIPASELLRELERKGTLGLVARIRFLQQRGVIQQ